MQTEFWKETMLKIEKNLCFLVAQSASPTEERRNNVRRPIKVMSEVMVDSNWGVAGETLL